MFQVIILYTNHSTSFHPFSNYHEAMEFCRNGISYSSERVRRVEIHERANGFRAIWDEKWDTVSKAAGLRNAP